MKRVNEKANRQGTAEEISKFSHYTAPKTVLSISLITKILK